MILYHYTAARFVERIKREGITLGAVLEDVRNGKARIRRGLIWLTVNANQYAQGWNTQTSIRYDRTEYRITVEVPAEYEPNVIRWLDYCASGRVSARTAAILNDPRYAGDPENWRLYRGQVPPAWFRDIDHKVDIQAILRLARSAK